MKTYEVTITETVGRIVQIKSWSADSARTEALNGRGTSFCWFTKSQEATAGKLLTPKGE